MSAFVLFPDCYRSAALLVCLGSAALSLSNTRLTMFFSFFDLDLSVSAALLYAALKLALNLKP